MLSHLGSGAVIMQRRLEDTLAGQATPDDYAPGVWDTWNAKTPVEQRDDALAADTALLARIEAVTPEERSTSAFAMGPMTPAEAFARLVYGRLDPEHTPPGDHGPALDTLRRVFPGP